MTDMNAQFSDSPQRDDAPSEDTATSYPEGERLDTETGEPIEQPTYERAPNAPEHAQDGRHWNAPTADPGA